MGQTREAHRGCSRKSAQGKQGEHRESNQGMLANQLSTSTWLYHQDLPSKDRKIASMKEKELLQEKERIIEENKVIWLFIAALIYNFIHSFISGCDRGEFAQVVCEPPRRSSLLRGSAAHSADGGTGRPVGNHLSGRE